MKKVGPMLQACSMIFLTTPIYHCVSLLWSQEDAGAGTLPALLFSSHPHSLLAFQMANWKEPSSGNIHADFQTCVWEALTKAD